MTVNNYTNWTFYDIQNLIGNDPLSNLYISVSPPCINPTQTYFVRNTPIAALFDVANTCFKVDNYKVNQLYQATGFYLSEDTLARENNYFDDLKNHVPPTNFNINVALLKNNYQLYS